MIKIAVLGSGGGTNLQALIDAQKAGAFPNGEIALVMASNQKAYALERARNHGIRAVAISPKEFETREAFNEAFLAKVDEYKLDLIVLAGFLVTIPEAMTRKYKNRIINNHPSLNPSF